MATTWIQIPKKTWTPITSHPATVQNVGRREFFFVESTTPPVGENGPFRIGTPLQEYTVTPETGYIYAYSKVGTILCVTEGRNPRDVFLQDQSTPPIDFYFQKEIGNTTLAAGVAIDDFTITVADASGVTVGDCICIASNTTDRFYFGNVLVKNVNTLTLDTPLDYAFLTGDFVRYSTRNLNVVGTLASPQVFSIRSPNTNVPAVIDVTRLLYVMTTDTATNLNLFGNLPALTNGIVLRRNNGDVRNIHNVKTNRDLLNLAYDYMPFTATNPAQAIDGNATRYTFGGQDKHGVVIRLRAGESLDLIIQDDLSGLDSFNIIGAGHIVE